MESKISLAEDLIEEAKERVYQSHYDITSISPELAIGLAASVLSQAKQRLGTLKNPFPVVMGPASRVVQSVRPATPLASKAPDYVVSSNGTAFPVPKGAIGPVPSINQSGRVTGAAFKNGKGGANGQVSTMRIMNPTKPSGKSLDYPNGYVRYTNSLRQGVNPYTGKTVSLSESHYPF